MTILTELYRRKGEAHTQIEIGQQLLKQVNQELSQYLQENPGELNGAIDIKKNTGDTKKFEAPSNREGGSGVRPK